MSKWNVSCGPRQAKVVNAAASRAAAHAKSHVQISGWIDGESRRSVLYSPFGAADPAIAEAVNAVGESFGWELTRENHLDVAAAYAAVCQLPLPEVDQRRERAVVAKEVAEAEAKRAEAAKVFAEEVRKEELALRAECPWAVASDGHMANHVRAAKNIRLELARKFPGVKFSVKSDSFSMGNSVDVHWELGPTAKEVDAVIGKYQYGSFNGMEDIYEYDHSAHAKAVENVLGGSKYVHSHREIPSVVRDQVGRLLCEAQGVVYDANRRGLYGDGDAQYLGDHVHRIIAQASFPVGAKVVGVEPDDIGLEPYRLVFSSPVAPVVSSAPAGIAGVKLVENHEKDGYELHFAAKPNADVLVVLKAAGWRWSARNKCWYAKRSDLAKQVAERIVAAA